jgi:hypothetical protein
LPRSTAFQDRDGAIGDLDLEADLVSHMFRHSAVRPSPDPDPLRPDNDDAAAEIVKRVGSHQTLGQGEDAARVLCNRPKNDDPGVVPGG